MLNLILSWLRQAVKNAFLAGVQDAVAELEGRGDVDHALAVKDLRKRFAITEEKARNKSS